MRLTTGAVGWAIALALIILAVGTAAAEDLAERERAAGAATKAFVTELGGELKRELASGTPAEAIGVCSELAPRIANRLSREQGWRVTRVGTRVRNTMLGTPDAWEQGVLARFAERAAAGEPLGPMKHAEVVEEPDGTYYRFMKAIGVKRACLACHGSATDVAPQTAAALGERYPFDRATGYREGELRGAISIKQPMR